MNLNKKEYLSEISKILQDDYSFTKEDSDKFALLFWQRYAACCRLGFVNNNNIIPANDAVNMIISSNRISDLRSKIGKYFNAKDEISNNSNMQSIRNNGYILEQDERDEI